MDFHTLLQEQIEKHLTAEWTDNPLFEAFVESVNDSYLAFERDKAIMNHVFQEIKNAEAEIIKAKEYAEESEAHNRLIMNSALNSIITIDSNEHITFWNTQAASVFGWQAEEVLDKNIIDLIIPERHRSQWDIATRHYVVNQEETFFNKQLELILVNKAGDEFYAETSVIPVFQNGETFFCAFIQDISEKKQAENFRLLQEEKYKKVIAHMNLGLLEVDNEDVIQYANESFSKISGYETSDLIGKKPSAIIAFDDSSGIIKSKNELRKHGISDVYQLPIKNKNGDLRWWAISGAPNYDTKGNIIGSIGIHLDITEQKQLELDLENEKLKAMESSKAKEIFLANMSHEIRTPLNAIIGFLRELDKQELPELQKKHVRNSSIASKHLLAIINNILDISKIEAGEMSLDTEDFVFKKSISNVSTVLQSRFQHKKLKLNIRISSKIEKVLRGDSLRLEQILFNLLGNAIKFTHKGSISINCQVVTNTAVSQELEIAISDTGIGMEDSFVENIFNKFSQEDKGITRKYGGTGLGLSITKELVKLMGGRIDIQSKKNEGTTIRIYINFPKGSDQRIKNLEANKVVVPLDSISILLVEDNFLNRMVAQNSLEYFNCKVTEAENGLIALKILKSRKFDIILMDIQMPEMDGIEATEIIRKELQLKTPIIALTANAFKTEIDRCRKAGMDDYITKPYDENSLIEMIAKHTVNRDKSVLESGISARSLEENLYDLSSLKKLSRGNTEFYNKMILLFISQTTAVLEQINQAIFEHDFIEVSRLAHKIRPSIESLKISTISNALLLLEKTAKESKDKDQIAELFTTIKATLEKVIFQLQDQEF